MERHQGFTLIEVSIVLVIIGLLAGGVLAGQELIRASTLRSVMSQKEEIETATNTFRNKYNGLPGDLANATAFGFSANGNGDGKIGQFPVSQYGEVWQYFKQLSEAGLISGNYTGTNGPGSGRHAVPGTNVLASKIPKAGFTVVGWFGYTDAGDYTPKVYNTADRNVALFGTPHGNFETYAKAISAGDAWSIDTKYDDGSPIGGRFIAFRYFNCPPVGWTVYNVADSGIKCAFLIKLNF